MALLFSLTIFSAAALLFLLEPMIGKMLLPWFGGAPSVWNVCVAFFQLALLAAYGYAHALARLAPVRAQILVHLVVMSLPWLVLPFSLSPELAPQGASSPTWSLLAILCSTIALPFFVVASTSPLLGQWFAGTRHRHAGDPYYLYAASNAGSILGLLAYPALLEPRAALPEQSRGWAAGYLALTLLLAMCLAMVWRRRPAPEAEAAGESTTDKPTAFVRLSWIALAFIPSSLLLGATATLTTDVSPVPLIWVAPLALYLLSFVLVFARLPAVVHRALAVVLPLLVLTQIYHESTSYRVAYPMGRSVALHLGTFFCAAMVCHGELARRRPAAALLTEYYFWMSLGGVLGGVFNALFAPLLFNSLVEYPLAMSAACICSPLVLWRWPASHRWLDLPIAAVVGLTCAVILFRKIDVEKDGPILMCVVICCFTLGRPLVFGLSTAALFVAVGYVNDAADHVLLRQRGFYGVLQVRTDREKEYYYLVHGQILHGKQRISQDPEVRDVPLVYYYPTGPIGQVFQADLPATRRQAPIAAVGLGVGSLAYYGQPRQEFTFYEIDPSVERIARDERYFTFLRDARADLRVKLGDARLSLREAPDSHYGLIIVDAFSGDAIPVHLLTHEAIELYLAKLAPDGVLAFHISNRFLDLAPVLGNLALASELIGLAENDARDGISEEDKEAGKAVSHWVVLARRESDFGKLTDDDRWRRLAGAPEFPLWTDHYTSLWGITQWGK